tara:strand:- start:40 stop:582 length:543 start_codon:yes stop_codon:yes gene_type:complete
LINEIFFSKRKNYAFKIILFIIIFFDLIILGIYFGTSEIVDRFYFLKEEFSYISSDSQTISRFDLIKFGFYEIKNFILFGYGAGGFENLFQLKFINSSNLYANHAHSDIVEFIGEFGLIGFFLLLFSLIKFFLIKENYSSINLLIILYLIIILFFDFALHIPIIQIVFISFFVLNQKSIS